MEEIILLFLVLIAIVPVKFWHRLERVSFTWGQVVASHNMSSAFYLQCSCCRLSNSGNGDFIHVQSSSSSYHAISTDILDPFSPHVSIVDCFRLVLRATSRIGTELLYVGSNWSSCLCSSMWRGPQEYVTYEFVPTSPAVSHMSGSSYLDSFRDGW